MNRELFQKQAEICKALASPVRIEILHHLSEGELCVNDLQTRVECNLPNLSQHLRILKQVGLVNWRRQGAAIYYRLSCPDVTSTCSQMRQLLASVLQEQETERVRLFLPENQTANNRRTNKGVSA